jgi:F0F1-type ATP synthase membrane subunit c/vacuolar-type H+-ATPase subunit K
MEDQKPSVEAQYKSMLTIWAGLLMSQLMFVLIIFLTRPKLFTFDFSQPIIGNSGAMIVGFAVAAVTAVLFSFAFRKRLNERAVEAQDTGQVQSGLIIGLALCEASSLFGVTLAFAFDYQYFFLWIGLGVIAMLLHFPKRDELHAASYKK